ncbi:MAG: sigma-54-dependent Fis family transcriptional regulator [Melioribacteraceae bacterium]|nr:sigma-54-dependent Fis family transcriptional regulator [Melioribacteraceae bacterium]
MENKYIGNIFELAEILGKQSEYNEILRVISARISAMFKSDISSLLMVNPRSQDTYKTIFKKDTKVDKKKYSVVQSIIIGWVILNKKGILIEDLKNDTRFNQDILKGFPIKSAICTPLYCSDVIIGYIVVMNKDHKDPFVPEDLKLLEKLALISAPYLRNLQKIKDFFDIPLPEGTLINKYRHVGLLGKSKKFIELLQSIEAASKCDVRVVLEGETGTGKELVVRAIHSFSARSGSPFIAVDCGAIPNNLIESELFGHVRGAFTGANYDRNGLIRDANKGTLFLDEICNLSIEMQSKLLRVLQEDEVRPLGSSKTIEVDVRFIAASSKNLIELVEKGEFREDLYFRLMVYPIKMPALRERRADIPVIATYFLNKFAKQQKKKVEFIHKDILNYLMYKKWNGNVRELENFIERLVTLIDSKIESLHISSISGSIKEEILEFNRLSKKHVNINLNEKLSHYEKEIIEDKLIENDWNQSETARSLEIPEQTLRYKMKKFDITNKKID